MDIPIPQGLYCGRNENADDADVDDNDDIGHGVTTRIRMMADDNDDDH